MSITPLPTPPNRTSPGTFSERADAFLGALPVFAAEANALGSEISDNTAIAAAGAAAANTALSVTGSVKWVSGTTYPLDYAVWSPVNYQVYRRSIAGAGTTDPSLDPTNWIQVTGLIIPVSIQTYQSQGGL